MTPALRKFSVGPGPAGGSVCVELRTLHVRVCTLHPNIIDWSRHDDAVDKLSRGNTFVFESLTKGGGQTSSQAFTDKRSHVDVTKCRGKEAALRSSIVQYETEELVMRLKDPNPKAVNPVE